MNYDFIAGEILLFNKPLKWTSFDVVNKVRYMISHKINRKLKVGHAGTLDPLASGLVILCTGKKTKQIINFQNLEKEYIATFQFGATTPSFDLETEIDKHYPNKHITKAKIEEVIKTFIGEQEQIPPVFSAKKINGKRAYINARKGIETKMRPSIIKIYNISIIEESLPDTITIKVNCGKGTYIRALARDFGVKLDSGAHLIKLKRTKIGDYNINNAISIKDFEKIIQ